jgi:hypothetical protein
VSLNKPTFAIIIFVRTLFASTSVRDGSKTEFSRSELHLRETHFIEKDHLAGFHSVHQRSFTAHSNNALYLRKFRSSSSAMAGPKCVTALRR